MFIDDCIEGTKKLFNSNLKKDVYNIGSDEQVSINQMISTIEDIDLIVKKNYLLDKPKGSEG